MIGKEKKNTTLNLVKPSFEKELWDIINSYLCKSHAINPPYVDEVEKVEDFPYSATKAYQRQHSYNRKEKEGREKQKVCFLNNGVLNFEF